MKDTKMNWGLVYLKDGKYTRLERFPGNEYDQMPHFTRNDLLTGKPFFYNGHFTRLREFQRGYLGESFIEPEVLQYDREEFVQSMREGLCLMKIATDKHFILYHPTFGNITISFNECQLKPSDAIYV